MDHVVFEEAVGVERQQEIGQLAGEPEGNQLGDREELRRRAEGVSKIDTDQATTGVCVSNTSSAPKT